MNFSVVMSVWEGDDPVHLQAAFNSLVAQTLLPTEVVVVVDGPVSSRLDAVIEQYLSQYDFFKSIYLCSNKGPAHAWNEGIRNSAFEWIARMDADDICSPDRFELQVAYLEKFPYVDILGGQIIEFIEDPEEVVGERRVPLEYDELLNKAKRKNPFNHVTVFFKKKAYYQAGGYYQIDGFVDYFLWVRMLRLGMVGKNIDQLLVKVRVGNDMVGRRRGGHYARSELIFNLKSFDLGFFSYKDAARNILLRCPFRLLPKFLISYCYRNR